MNSKKNRYKQIFSVVLLLLLMISMILGISYAIWHNFFAGTKENSISTGTVSFSYIESETNNIKITNALPISDINGKKLTNSNEMFDFTVASTSSFDVDYDVYASIYKDEIPEEFVKVYLTDQNDLNLYDDLEVKTFKDLSSYDGDSSKKLLYSSSLNSNKTSESLRLRVWISSEYQKSIEELTYAFKVNVKARI